MIRFFIIGMVCFFSHIALQAQPFTLEPSIKPVELKLHKFNPGFEEKAKGRLSITEVKQVKDTLYYFVKGASIYSPSYVGIQTEDPNNGVKVSLHKMAWKNADRSGETDGKGAWNEMFKTENDFGIRVISNGQPVDYSLVVWVGDEPKIELPTVFKNADGSADSGESFFKKNGTYIIIGLLVLIVLFLLFKNKKNKN